MMPLGDCEQKVKGNIMKLSIDAKVSQFTLETYKLDCVYK